MKGGERVKDLAVGVDFDGPIVVDIEKLRAEAAQELYELDLPAELFKRGGAVKAGKLTRAQYTACIGLVADEPRYAERYQAADGFPEVLIRLLDAGNRVTVVSLRWKSGVENAQRWAAQKGLPREVAFVAAGEMGSKLPYVSGFHAFVDDRRENLEEMYMYVPHLFLMSPIAIECAFAHVVHDLWQFEEELGRIV